MRFKELPHRSKELISEEIVDQLFADTTFRKSGLNTMLSEEQVATEFEKLIVEGWNEFLNKGEISEKKIGTTSFTKPIEKIINAMNQHEALRGREIEMIHTGGTIDKSTLSEFWKTESDSSPDATPKSDAITDDITVRLSMKESGGSQLMSAGHDESLATFKSAEKSLTESGKASKAFSTKFKKIKHDLSSALTKIDYSVKGQTMKSLKYILRELRGFKEKSDDENTDSSEKIEDLLDRSNLKDDLLPRFQEIYSDFVAKDDILKDKLKDQLTSFFEDNKDFKKYFVFEAASGFRKFNTEKPKANYFLIFSKSGSVIKIEEIGDSPESLGTYLDKIADDIKIRPRWKHDQPALALDVKGDKKNESLFSEDTAALETCILTAYRDLETEVLEEGWMGDLITKIDPGAILVKYTSKVKEFLKKIFEGIMTYLEELLAKGINYFYEFFGFSIDSVEVSEYTF